MALVVVQAQVLVHPEQVQELLVAVPVHLVTELGPALVQDLDRAPLVAIGIQEPLVQEHPQVAALELVQALAQPIQAAVAPELRVAAQAQEQVVEQVQVPVVAHLEAVPVAEAVQVVNYNNYSKTKNPVDSTGFFLFKPNH